MKKNLENVKLQYIFDLSKTNNMTTTTTKQQVIETAKEVMKANNMEFVTIWKVGKSFSFNFEKKEIGYSVTECGVKRSVIEVIK